MNESPPCLFKPVLRRSRQEWHIPVSNSSESVLQEEQIRRAALCEGTTPLARDIFLKILFQTKRLIEQNSNTAQVISQIETRLTALPELRSEFALLFCRLCGQAEASGELTVHDLATLMVLRTRLKHAA